MNYKFAFVVLHYITTEDTIECVDSILHTIDYENYHIIIVDNGSPNNSGKKLESKYKNNDKVKTILNKKNLGFAKGNNIGFMYAKQKLKSDFIALINNDTIIEQKEFIIKILEQYDKKNFHILGPDIVSSKDGGHQNPAKLTLQNQDELRLLIKVYSTKLVLNYFLLDEIIEETKKKVFKTAWIKTGEKNTPSWKDIKENVKLHGSAIVFSPKYIDVYDGLFPKTFMFVEESILYFIAKRDKLKTIYFPQVKILHKEDSSTNTVYNKSFKQRRFYYKNFIKSAKIFLELMGNTK